jgi:cellobiose phosphorylase
VIAEALLGHGERAWKYFTQIIPQNVINRVGLERYASEPYAWVSNIVGPENPRFGWGNISHVTGTAAWMDVAASAYLLGVRAELDGLRIDPAIPGAWEQFSVTRRYAGSEVHLRIENPENVESGVVSLKVEGQEIRSEGVPVIPRQLLEGRRRVEVQVRMG